MPQGTLTRLHRSLRDRAEAVDTVVQAPLSPPTRHGYRRWLCELYRFISAFEKSLLITPGLELPFVRARLKAGHLSSDLLALGLTARERMRLADRCNVPDFTDPIEALGWLFVVDRLTLELDAIRARLMPELALEIDLAGSFLDGYADDQLEMWFELERVLDDVICGEHDLKALRSAALAALDCLEMAMTDIDLRQTDPVVPVMATRT